MTTDAAECPSEEFDAVVAMAQTDERQALVALSSALIAFPTDARLHFLNGSLLASQGRFDEAKGSMRAAVTLAPGFDIARFQLGLLTFTSGDAPGALEVWAPLFDRPSDQPLRLFAEGLKHLAENDFVGALERLRQGQALNTQLPPLNRDMQLIIDRIEGTSGEAGDENQPISSTHFLLRQYADKITKH